MKNRSRKLKRHRNFLKMAGACTAGIAVQAVAIWGLSVSMLGGALHFKEDSMRDAIGQSLDDQKTYVSEPPLGSCIAVNPESERTVSVKVYPASAFMVALRALTPFVDAVPAQKIELGRMPEYITESCILFDPKTKVYSDFKALVSDAQDQRAALVRAFKEAKNYHGHMEGIVIAEPRITQPRTPEL